MNRMSRYRHRWSDKFCLMCPYNSRSNFRTCGSMDDHSNKSVCKDGERQIVWAWAMDAVGRSLPEGL